MIWVWILWAVFWLIVVGFMTLLFQSVARHDRILLRMQKFESWSMGEVKHYIKMVESWIKIDIAKGDDLESLEAARRVLRERGVING